MSKIISKEELDKILSKKDKIPVVCAWCQPKHGSKKVHLLSFIDEPNPDGKVSHGICEKCKEEILSMTEGFEELFKEEK